MNAKRIHSLLSILIIALVSGCATVGKDLVRDNTVKIEKVSSRWAKVQFVRVVQEGDTVALRGEVRRWPTGRGPIPGHIDLEVIGPDGGVLEQATLNYQRRSVKSRYAGFHGTLDTIPPTGSTIRVIHDLRSHDAM